MSDAILGRNGKIRLMVGDVTDQEIEAFVYYASHDLKIGSGFGTAITQRGGPSIQKELEEFGTLETTAAVVTGAGNMKADHIIHAVGPRFQEVDVAGKLAATMRNTLRKAEEKGIKKIAFPTMGTGFYGVPLDVCARVMIETIGQHLNGDTGIEEVTICCLDSREFGPFRNQMQAMEKA